ncbi:sterol desaturase family protein [Sphingomonas swuensis]|uniref:Sterol desaturase family protein n=1 Tax=Sphingomonas swuensis TaxID=977800 RepID=A0ABP7SC62_9SPHN
MTLPDPVILAIPFFLATLALETWWLRRAGRGPDLRDSATSVGLGLGSLAAGALTAGLVFALGQWLHGFAPVAVPIAWWSFLLCFVLDDLAYYAFHRSAHRVRWFWASHVVHHSSEAYNLSTALRQTWTGFVSLNFLFRLPLFLIFPPELMLFCAGVNLVYQYWIHTETIGRMPGWFEAVMNTPSHHRVHHAVNPRYLDRNYAGVFIVWDRLFGTFEPERADDRPRYGIVTPLRSRNILWAALHEWVGIARDLRAAPGGSRLGYLWREPGWSHDGSRETSDSIRATWHKRAADEETRNDDIQAA